MNNSNLKAYIIVGAIALLCCIGVGWAAFQTTLTINGTATVKAMKWDIHFASLADGTVVNGAKIVTKPTLSATNIGDYAVTFTKPNSSVTFTFDVENTGTFDAKLDTLTIPTPKCTGTGTNATTDATNVCKYITYTLTKSDDSAFAAGTTLAAETGVEHLKLTLTYGNVATEAELPTADVNVSNLQVSMLYTQQ